MKISENGSVQSRLLRRLGRTSNGQSSDFAHHLSSGDDSQLPASAPVTGTASVGSVDSLLSLQEVGDAATGRSKGLQRAAGLLDQLDEIRHGLLVGGLSRHSLLDLARAVREQRATIGDPRLAEVLDEIELRAEVELAKYSLKG